MSEIYKTPTGWAVRVSDYASTANCVCLIVEGLGYQDRWYYGHARPWLWQMSVEEALRKAIQRAEHLDYRECQKRGLMQRAQRAALAEDEVRRILGEIAL